MKRTTTRRRRELKHFVADNRRLFPFVGLFAVGVAAGVAVVITTKGGIPPHLLSLSPIPDGGWWQAFGNSCFATVLWLAALFLFGLWSCGAPFIMAVPLFHGLGLGMTEAHYYSRGIGGVGIVAAAVMPVGLLTAAILIAAGTESLRMSTGLCRHLMGGETENPGRDFHLYCLRFLLFLAAAIAVSLMDILLRGWILPV